MDSSLPGPITVLNQTIFDLINDREDAPDSLQSVGWVYLWGAILHWVTAALNCTLAFLIYTGSVLQLTRQGATS